MSNDSVLAVKHGTITAYTNHRCRCPQCRTAKADYDSSRCSDRPETDHDRLSDLLNELCPTGLTTDCPVRKAVA